MAWNDLDEVVVTGSPNKLEGPAISITSFTLTKTADETLNLATANGTLPLKHIATVPFSVAGASGFSYIFQQRNYLGEYSTPLINVNLLDDAGSTASEKSQFIFDTFSNVQQLRGAAICQRSKRFQLLETPWEFTKGINIGASLEYGAVVTQTGINADGIPEVTRTTSLSDVRYGVARGDVSFAPVIGTGESGFFLRRGMFITPSTFVGSLNDDIFANTSGTLTNIAGGATLGNVAGILGDGRRALFIDMAF